jgi:hypothetical protein
MILGVFIYAVGVMSSLLMASSTFTAGFAAGGAVMLINALASMRRIMRADFQHQGAATASLLGGFYLRLTLVGVCLYALIAHAKLDPLGLVAGLSVVPAGLFLMPALIYIANRRPKEI